LQFEFQLQNMKKIILFTGILACVLVSCGEKKQQFTISGEISGNTNKTLYLENVGTAKIVVLDSAKVESGSFKFKQGRPAVPGFYRLRLGNQVINLAIDSTETIIVKADTAHFAGNYTLEGDVYESQKIKELTLLHAQTAKQYTELQKQQEAGELSIDQYVQAVNAVIDSYKTAAKPYIISDFLAPSAYFALFQQINNLFIFDIYDKDDNKLFGAVANAWNQAYPESPRALQLKNIYTGSRAVLRGEKPVEVQESSSATVFDISLPSLDGQEIRLADAGQGKVTLIDFTAYAGAGSPVHNRQLAELYTKYQSQGLEIYQISLDTDGHLWQNAAANLPWIRVRDEQSIYSPLIQKYNVRDIPTTYIRDREGEIVARIEDYSTLNKTVAGYFKK
jgi:peroxiredoxin